jgi:hypothetical protein
MRRFALGLLFVTACATPGDDLFKKVHVDAGPDAAEVSQPDAFVTPAPDARPPDAAPDAAFTAR